VKDMKDREIPYIKILQLIKNFSNISIFLAYNANVDAIKIFKDGKEVEELINQFSVEEILKSIKRC